MGPPPEIDGDIDWPPLWIDGDIDGDIDGPPTARPLNIHRGINRAHLPAHEYLAIAS